MGVANLDILTAGVAVAASALLGFAVLFSGRKSPSNRWFFTFTLVTAAWGTLNVLSYQTHDAEAALWLIRCVVFFAVWQTLSFYLFLLYFSHEDAPPRSKWFWVSLILAGVAAILTLSPFVFTSAAFSTASQVADPVPGPAISIFALIAVMLIVEGLYSLFRQLKAASLERKLQLKTIAWGAGAMFLLIIIFDLGAPVAFSNTHFIPLSSLFILPFIAAASYAILREHLFNVKVAATAVLVFVLAVASFLDVIFSDTLPQVLLRTGVFVLVLVFGINLVRGVLREVEQRERIEKLAQELEETNERQESLIHFVSHEVKGFLARYMGAFAGYVEGDYGALPAPALEMAQRMLPQTREDARMVTDILQASNLKKGTITFKKEPFDLKALVEKRFAALKPAAEAKGLAMSLAVDAAGAPYMMLGDEAQFGDHVLQNLIQNSINYTPSGSIAVSLGRENGRIVFAVKDTGVGITDEDKKRLFTEGGHGKDSVKVNAHSTGYGLYIAKEVVDAHGGTIRAESEGAGKGSRFVVELPAQA